MDKINLMNRMAFVEKVFVEIIYFNSQSSAYTNEHNLVIDGGVSYW